MNFYVKVLPMMYYNSDAAVDSTTAKTFSLNRRAVHACKTPPVEGAGAGSLPVPYPGGAKKKKAKKKAVTTIAICR
jgi:hypothetical protein